VRPKRGTPARDPTAAARHLAESLMPLLEIDGLNVQFGPLSAPLIAVEDVHLVIDAGEVVGCVGESGSGKSVTALAVMGLIEFPGRVQARHLMFNGHDLRALSDEKRRQIAGKDMAMIFQDPLASLNPSFNVAYQLEETLRVHGTGEEQRSAKVRHDRTLELLAEVEIPDPAARLNAFPHQLSGGMAQRVMIAMAIACRPKLLIADEPTTALDVTVQAQVLELIQALRDDFGTAVILITHDLGVVAQMADDVAVMYAGRVLEQSSRETLFTEPEHPYTWGLLQSIPRLDAPRTERLSPIAGSPPSLINVPRGCTFHPRCPYAPPPAFETEPALAPSQPGHLVRCHLPVEERKRLWQSLQNEHPALR
jgi:oligopeptide/dipeptide ABC transporter ATP-binding protein